MGYGTPKKSEEYNPRENQSLRERIRSPLRRRQARYEPYEPTERKQSRASRAVSGIKSIGRGTLREAHGFVKEVRSEGIKSGYKTQRSIQREGRQLRTAPRERRTRIIQRRQVMPGSPSLGQRAVIESSQGYVPILDRQFFSNEEKDLIGVGGRDMSNLVNSAESNLKKKEQRYY